MTIFKATRTFPAEERFSLIDQIRRSSRSVCSNLAEAWGKRRYPAAFVSKLSDVEAEAEETRAWIDFAAECNYLAADEAAKLDSEYEVILKQVVDMIRHPEEWQLPR